MELTNCDCLVGLNDLKITENMCIVTDPPFNQKYHYNSYDDNKKEAGYIDWIISIVDRGIPFVIIHYPEMLHKFSIKLGYAPTKVVSWVYNSNTGKQHRDVAFYNVKPNFSQVQQQYKDIHDKRNWERMAKGIGAKIYDWWNIDQVKNKTKEKLGITHPCVMPGNIMSNIIGILPHNITTIIDPFTGSGSTGIAAIEWGKEFIGYELDLKYYELSRKRISNACCVDHKIKPIFMGGFAEEEKQLELFDN